MANEYKNFVKYIAVDFDGTCVTHDYPAIGKEIGAVLVLKRLVEAGHQLILNTMRSGVELHQAVEWFKSHEIPLIGINTNPTQHNWTSSPKAYAHLYIDDAALGCPLITESGISQRPFVDWHKVERQLMQLGFLSNQIYSRM